MGQAVAACQSTDKGQAHKGVTRFTRASLVLTPRHLSHNPRANAALFNQKDNLNDC